MAQVFTNNAATTLASSITNVATSISIASATNFPSLSGGDYFLATITQSGLESSWEIVKVTAISGTTLTVTRAQEGTTAQAWTSDSKLEIRLTAQGIVDNARGASVAMAANDMDLSKGVHFTKTFTSGAVSLTVSKPPASGTFGSFVLEGTNMGLATITWPTGSKWDGGTPPSSLPSAGVTIVTGYTVNGGSTYRMNTYSKDSK